MIRNALIPRLVSSRLLAALEDSPAVLIHGPRQCGKTTLAQSVGQEQGYRYYSFDDAVLLDAVHEDPLGFVGELPERVILDEVQKAPGLFSALKMAIDRDRYPGRFLLTGSANVLFVPKLSDSLAGRMETVPLFPLAQCEIERSSPQFLATLFSGRFKMKRLVPLGKELFERVLKGGYPVPLQKARWSQRHHWYRDYVNALVKRDIYDLGRLSTFDAIPRLLALAAGQTARLLNISELASPFELSRPTIRHYSNLLEKIFLVEFLASWHNNQIKRLVKTPKLHMGDTGLAGALLALNIDDLKGNRPVFGQMLETFVYGELKRQASWEEDYYQFFHFRDKYKYEVDIVIQNGLKTAGVEVKAAATVTGKDFRGMKQLRQSLGKNFACGVVIYNGEHVLPFGDRFYAVPIKMLWSNE